MLVAAALLSPVAISPPHRVVGTQDQTVLQPAMKRDIYVFLDQFPDRANTTTPAQIQAKLAAVDAYFLAATNGAWSFNWTLFYPTLGQPWYTVNETYAQAGSSSNLTPVADVIAAAYDAGVRFPAPETYPLVPSALIIHAGDDGAMTGNTTDIWSVTTGPYCSGFTTSPPNAYCLLTAIVAETDPVGVIAHELTHELERFDEYGNPMGITLGHSVGPLPPGMVPVDWWDPMYQGLRNPANNASIPAGTYPSEFMAWNRMALGFLPLSQIAVVDHGQSARVTLNDLEEPTTGFQAIRIPLGNNSQSHWYYFVELRKGVSYDAYFPWLTSIYPNRIGMLVYWVNVSASGQPFQIFLVKAHSADATAQQALFGPCSAPCSPAFTLNDTADRVNLTIVSTSDSSFVVQVNNAATSSGGTTPPPNGSPSPSNGTQPVPGQPAPACPGANCFLGIVEVGGYGTWLTIAAIAATGLGLFAIVLHGRRKRAKRKVSWQPQR